MKNRRTSEGTHIVTAEAGDWSSIVLPEGAAILRDPPRPVHLRQPGFDAQFDARTLFYDAFLLDGGQVVRLIGPKLMNFLPHLLEASITLADDADHVPLGFYLHEKRKIAYLDITLPDAADVAPRLRFDLGALGIFEVQPGVADLALFGGRRVAFTLFKFEPNHWLRDWAEFNVAYHKADALMVYHNACEDRTTEEIAAALEGIPGLKLVMVANWPYPYGPSDGDTGLWDSNFCQAGMFEQMHWRYLRRARSVLNCDIDELVVTRGHRSIFEMVEQSPDQHVKFVGHWIGGVDAMPPVEVRRHRDFVHTVTDPAGKLVEEKWAAVPGAFTEENRWGVHGIAKINIDPVDVDEAGLRHFRPINTGWKLDRAGAQEGAVLDTALLDAYRHIGWLP